ncbi:hypothetical protein BDV12DRAFT_176965 [Aspergillus spectabilis]
MGAQAQAKMDPEPRNARRGRPRKKGPDESEPVQARRARMRRAQEAFRNRQKVAQDAEKQLLTKQEAAITQMSSAFVDFVDFLLHSKDIQKDSGLMQKLHETIGHFVSANEPENTSEGCEGETPIASKETTTNDIPLISSLLTPGKLSPENIFGNGWPEYLPTSFTQLDRWDPQSEMSPFSRNLVYYTLSIAYQCLSSSPGFPLELAERIFRFSLLLHSKEELLFNLRWFLGPGNQELIRLAFVSFESTHSTTTTGLPTPEGSPILPSLQPAVDVYATDMTPVKEVIGVATGPFLNAREVEQYLHNKGARFLDSETIEIALPERLSGRVVEGLFPLQTSFLRPSSDATAAPYDVLMDDDTTTDRLRALAGDNNASLDTDLWDLFNFNELSGDPVMSYPDLLPSSSAQYGQSEQQVFLGNPTRRLRTSVLFQNLACIGLCLSRGPGYLREYIDHAIFSSIVQ